MSMSVASGPLTVGRSPGATRTMVTVLGVLAAVTGIEHGVGEINQGPVKPPAVVFESWPDVAAFDPLNGEPAMSLVPNLLVSGFLSVLVALLVGLWAVRYGDRPHSGSVLASLSLLLLLVGGGFGPPLLGLVTAGLAGRIHAHPARHSGPVSRLAARLWPWPLVAAVTCFLGLVPGTALLQVGAGLNNATLVTVLTVVAFTSIALAVWSARARDRALMADGSAPGESWMDEAEHSPARRRPPNRKQNGSAARPRSLPIWAAIWFAVLVLLFVPVTLLTVTLWVADPGYTESTPVADLAFFALGAIIGSGFVSQVRTRPPVAGVQQAVVAAAVLGAAGLVGQRIEPLVGALVILGALAVLVTLHPAGGHVLRPGTSVSVSLAVLSAIAAIPAVWQAARFLDAAVQTGPSCFLGKCVRGDRLAELAATLLTVPMVGMLAALKPPGWRLPLWSAGTTSVLIGAVSLTLPDVPESLGVMGGAWAVGWGVLFLAVGEGERRHADTQERARQQSSLYSGTQRKGPL